MVVKELFTHFCCLSSPSGRPESTVRQKKPSYPRIVITPPDGPHRGDNFTAEIDQGLLPGRLPVPPQTFLARNHCPPVIRRRRRPSAIQILRIPPAANPAPAPHETTLDALDQEVPLAWVQRNKDGDARRALTIAKAYTSSLEQQVAELAERNRQLEHYCESRFQRELGQYQHYWGLWNGMVQGPHERFENSPPPTALPREEEEARSLKRHKQLKDVFSHWHGVSSHHHQPDCPPLHNAYPCSFQPEGVGGQVVSTGHTPSASEPSLPAAWNPVVFGHSHPHHPLPPQHQDQSLLPNPLQPPCGWPTPTLLNQHSHANTWDQQKTFLSPLATPFAPATPALWCCS